MWLIGLSALARPPALPTWDETTPPAEGVVAATPAAPAATAALANSPLTVPFEGSPNHHAWASEADLTVAIAGEWERRYYLQATLRAGGHVTHWQQGPYDAPDETLLVDLVLPAEGVEAVADGAATVVARLVATDFDGRIRGRWGLEPVPLLATEQGVMGLSRAATLETWIASP